MRKIVSPVDGKIIKINVKPGQEISKVLIIKATKTKNSRGNQDFTCNESLALLAKLTRDYHNEESSL